MGGHTMIKDMFVLVFVLLLLISPVAVQAGTSLGTVQVDRSKDAYPGDQVTFKVLFFNIHGEGDLEIKLGSEHPGGWEVSMPETIDVSRTDIITGSPKPESGYEFIRAENGYIKAKPVVIRVFIPESAEPGYYPVKVSGRTQGGNGMLSVSQTRSFSFRVKVNGDDVDSDVEDTAEEKRGEAGVETYQPESGDVFIIDKDKEDRPYNDSDTESSGNETMVVEETSGLDSITGAVTAYPVSYSVLILVFSLLLFAFLKIKKKI